MSASPPDSSDACCARRDVTAVILAAGSGTRLGGIAKATLAFRGRTLLRHAAESVAPFVRHIVVGVRPEDVDWAETELRRFAFDGSVACVAGGDTRQETLDRLIARCTTRYVLVHEVARPWVPPEDFQRLLATVKHRGAVALFTPLPVRDGLALARNGRLRRTLPRAEVVSVQAPHAYRRSVLQRACALAARHGWQEESTAALMCRARRPLALVEGSTRNVKVTYPEDLSPLQNYDQPGPPQASHACGG